MWSGFDPELQKDFNNIRTMVALRHQTPTTEWPLIFIEDFDALFVVREWPDGTITAYATSDYTKTPDDRSSAI